MNSFSNDTVINLFKAVNEQNRTQVHNIIFDKLSFLVYRATSRYKRFQNYEDLNQDGFIGLLKAIRKFDHTRYPNFFLYAQQWIKHSVKRSASRYDIVYNPNRKKVVYADLSEKEEEDPNNLEDMYFKKELSSGIQNTIIKLSEREQNIVNSIFGINTEQKSLREIASEVELTHEGVRQIKNAALSKLKREAIMQEINS